MDSISGYKDRALANLKGNWDKAAIATLIYFLIEMGVSTIGQMLLGDTAGVLFNYVWTIICIPLSWGFAVLFLDFIRGNGIVNERMFDGYKDFVRVFVTYLLYGIAVGLGCILLIVPGIILALMFSQFTYILKDNKEIGSVDALKLSAQMMNGHKMDLFLLGLSFIGWIILALMTLGIGLLFLEPYMQTTFAHFYEDLKEENNMLNE